VAGLAPAMVTVVLLVGSPRRPPGFVVRRTP